jgi:hypothetical protein
MARVGLAVGAIGGFVVAFSALGGHLVWQMAVVVLPTLSLGLIGWWSDGGDERKERR